MTTSSEPALQSGLASAFDRTTPAVRAVAAMNRTFAAIGTTANVMRLAGPRTQEFNPYGRRVLPGLIGNHGAGSFARSRPRHPHRRFRIYRQCATAGVIGPGATRRAPFSLSPAQRALALDRGRRNAGVAHGRQQAIACSARLSIAGLEWLFGVLGRSCWAVLLRATWRPQPSSSGGHNVTYCEVESSLGW